jgi:hypothetical protein
MAAIVSTRILALQATSPRIVPVPLPTNVTVDLSNTSQALNNLPSYTRVSGVTTLATQSTLANGGGYLTGFGSVSSQNSLAFGGAYLTGFGAVASQSVLAYGGGYLTGFGVLASQSTVNLASQITGSLANSNVSGLGALALLGSVALDGVYVVNNLAATRIGAGTIAAGSSTRATLPPARSPAATLRPRASTPARWRWASCKAPPAPSWPRAPPSAWACAGTRTLAALAGTPPWSAGPRQPPPSAAPSRRRQQTAMR